MSLVKTVDVSNFIRDMVDMTMVFEVDEAGYVVKKSNGERVTINEGGIQCPLLIYQETITDATALVVNPLAEGLGSTPSSLWFYNTQKTALLGRIFTLFIAIIKAALDEKKSKADSENHIPMELMNIASKIIEDVDDKLLTELTPLTEDKDTNEFITIYYQRKQLRSVLRCSLFEVENSDIPIWKSKFPKVRKKTWEILERIMLGILHISDKDDISKFTKKADEISCARLSSFLNVLMSVYQEINPLLDIINPDIAIDLSKLAHHLNRLTGYAENAKFMVQPSRGSLPASTPSQIAVPGAMPAVPMATPVYAAPAPSPMNQPGVSLVPGPAFVDGRVSAPTPVMSQGAYPQPQMYGQPVPQPMMMGGYMQPPPYQPPYGGYMAPPPAPYMDPNSIPFDPPYVQNGNYMNSSIRNINILPPGAPQGYNPNYR